MAAFVPTREERWYYAADAMAHVEARNCALGCSVGLSTPEAFVEFGPGGTCHLLALVAVGTSDPIPELDDDGENVTCLAREAL